MSAPRSKTLIDALDKMAPDLGSVALRRFRPILRLFPARAVSGFLLEKALDEDGDDADLCLHCEDVPALKRILAGDDPDAGVAAFLFAHPAWKDLRAFWRAWAHDPTLGPVINCWLEFDARRALPQPPVPSVFFRIDSADYRDWYVGRALETLRGGALPDRSRQAIQSCFECLPEGAYVSQLGVMRARPGAALRVYVRDVHPGAVGRYLREVGFPADPGPAGTMAGTLAAKAAQINVQLEIAETVSPRLSLECQIHRKTQTWRPVLDYLAAEQLCSARNRQVFLDWPAKIALSAPELPRTVKRYVNHVKLVSQPGLPLKAKGYLGVYWIWA